MHYHAATLEFNAAYAHNDPLRRCEAWKFVAVIIASSEAQPLMTTSTAFQSGGRSLPLRLKNQNQVTKQKVMRSGEKRQSDW